MIERGWLFLKNAGTIILGISIVLWFLTAYPKHLDPAVTADVQIAASYAGQAGHLIEPLIKPLGFDWRIGEETNQYLASDYFEWMYQFAEKLIEEAEPDEESFVRWVLGLPKGTGVFCANDVLAHQLLLPA